MNRRLTSVALFLAACAHPASLMTPDAYRSIHHTVPYTIDISCGDAHLVYVGSHHTNDPASVDVQLIESLWAQLEPKVALNEGGDPPTAKTREEAISKYGEAGLIRFLAARDHVPVRSFDPSKAYTARRLATRFTQEQIKTFFLLLQVEQHRRNPYEPFEIRMERVFRVLAADGFSSAPHDLTELDATYRRMFPSAGSFRDVPHSQFDPIAEGSWMNAFARAGNEVRDAYMLGQMQREYAAGKRVFAAAGASHTVMQEPVIRAWQTKCRR